MKIISLNQVVRNLQTAINGEASAIVFYSRLLQIAPNDTHRRQIRFALEDEKKHLKKFRALFTSLTGKSPKVIVSPVRFRTYKEGLKIAFNDELDAAELYRDTILLTNNKRVREVFFEAMTDEQEHANRFLFLLNMLRVN